MYKKTMVALLAFLFAAPVYATSAQEQVNAKVLSYLKQGKIEALATYLGSFEKCPGDEGTIKEGTVPSVCAKEKFSRKGQVGTNDKAINVTVEAILSPGFTKTVTLNAVRLDKAINDGLGKMYRERFKRDPLTYNKNKYVSFYNTYKETWLKEDVLRVEIRWINNKPSETGLYDEMLYNSTELAMEIRRPISEVNPKYWNDVNDRYLYCVVPEVWEYAVKQKNGKAV
ncbi:MAG: hypothetical protein J5601_02945, partial [Elusimicrobiaceae bacterium]|nr:hypothetical protein [Elusimicrobiaceae bacterium]